MQVTKRIDAVALRDELAAGGFEYAGVGVVDSVLTGYYGEGLTEPVPDEAAAIVEAHAGLPQLPPTDTERIAAIEGALLDLLLGGV